MTLHRQFYVFHLTTNYASTEKKASSTRVLDAPRLEQNFKLTVWPMSLAQSKNSNPAAQEEAMRTTANNVLTSNLVGYAQRPILPEGFDYVEPTLASCAHKVVDGDDNCTGNVFVGPRLAASQMVYPSLVEANVAAIVNCTKHAPCCHRKAGVKYCHVPVNDEDGADILVYLIGATSFIHAVRSSGSSVLVHCEMGVSRSATVAIAYLIRYQNMTRDEAYVHVKKKRPKINPNQGFWKQLEMFEDNFFKKNSELSCPRDQEVFDAKWALTSNAFFATCRELPEVVKESDCFSHLKLCSFSTMSRVLFVALGFIWGRGVLDVDIEWLSCVCRILDDNKDRSERVLDAVKTMLRDDDSEFVQVWSGEIYEDQIKRILDILERDNVEE